MPLMQQQGQKEWILSCNEDICDYMNAPRAKELQQASHKYADRVTLFKTPIIRTGSQEEQVLSGSNKK